MTAPQNGPDQAAIAARLALELAGMRDALTRLSLAMQDYQSEVDAMDHGAGMTHACATIEHIKSTLPKKP
jgi:hypothetical protein